MYTNGSIFEIAIAFLQSPKSVTSQGNTHLSNKLPETPYSNIAYSSITC